jgi:hypothetical protein
MFHHGAPIIDRLNDSIKARERGPLNADSD